MGEMKTAKTGNSRRTGLEQFYTPRAVARQLAATALDLLPVGPHR